MICAHFAFTCVQVFVVSDLFTVSGTVCLRVVSQFRYCCQSCQINGVGFSHIFSSQCHLEHLRGHVCALSVLSLSLFHNQRCRVGSFDGQNQVQRCDGDNRVRAKGSGGGRVGHTWHALMTHAHRRLGFLVWACASKAYRALLALCANMAVTFFASHEWHR